MDGASAWLGRVELMEWARMCRVHAREAQAHPTPAEAAVRDGEGLYGPQQPWWARVTSAQRLTAPSSDRTVRPAAAPSELYN